VDPLTTIQAGLGIAKGLSGLFGKKKEKRVTLMQHAGEARQAAEQYGFNPLTMLGVTNTGYNPGSTGSLGALGDMQSAVGLLSAQNESTDDAEENQTKQAERDVKRVEKQQRKADSEAGVVDDYSTDGGTRFVGLRPGMYGADQADASGSVRRLGKTGIQVNGPLITAQRPRMDPKRAGGDFAFEKKSNLSGGPIYIPKDYVMYPDNTIYTAGESEEGQGSGVGETYGVTSAVGNTGDRWNTETYKDDDKKKRPRRGSSKNR